MKLYHLHLLGNYDELYRENSEFVIDKNKFNNRIYDRIYNYSPVVSPSKYLTIACNPICSNMNYALMNELSIFAVLENLGKIRIDDVLDNLVEIINRDYYLETVSIEDLQRLLIDAENTIFKYININAERALEEYRINNCIELPSRLHSLFACSLDGIEYWTQRITDDNVDIYEIEVPDNIFVSNSHLLPNRSLPYSEQIEQAESYFNPNKWDLEKESIEYLVQGKVKILKKVDEIRKEDY